MTLPRLKLISHKLCPFVQRARIVMNEKGIPHEIEFIDLGNKPDGFLEISPLGRVPVLLVDGEPLFESAVIAEYLDEITPGSLHPGEAFDRAQNRSWIEFASATLADVARFYRAVTPDDFGRARRAVAGRMAQLEDRLGAGPYFNGVEFALVDAAFGPLFRYFDLIGATTDIDFLAGHPKVTAYADALLARPSVRAAVVGDYRERLLAFLLARNSLLAELILTSRAA